jgi:hypothetical protein
MREAVSAGLVSRALVLLQQLHMIGICTLRLKVDVVNKIWENQISPEAPRVWMSCQLIIMVLWFQKCCEKSDTENELCWPS